MAGRIGSLDIVAAEANRERDAQVRHVESFDSKAGIIMGFAGVLVALSGGSSALSLAGHLAAAIAALLGLWAFIPRSLPAVDVHMLAARYREADPGFTKRHMLEATLDAVGRASDSAVSKARRVRYAMISLAGAVVLTAGSILIGR